MDASKKKCCEVDYDESSYPANAESDSDGESLGDQLQSRIRGLDLVEGLGVTEGTEVALSDDVLCVVCAEILVEPCSLHCGHSFCQLCLAALWQSHRNKSPLYLHCPVCRQPWVNFPGVNIQLRNIIEQNHKALVEWRRAHFSESDRATLTQFKRAKDGEWQKERQRTRPQLRPAVWVTILLIAVLLFSGIVSIAAAAVLVFLSGSNNELVHKPVIQWDNSDVMDWLAGLGDWASDQNISRVFSKEKINGAQLKLLNQSTLRGLGVDVDYFKTQSLLLAIKQLQQKEYVRPRNFNEFMAAHRKETFLIGIMYKLWPRFTFFYVYLFEYQDVFLPVYYSVSANQAESASQKSELTTHQVSVFGFEILLVPHYIAGLFAWHWLNLHPWICVAIMIHCVWATQSEVKKAVSYIFTVMPINWTQQFTRIVRLFLKNLLAFSLALSGGLIVWPIIPFFVCDGIFYLVLWNTVYAHVLIVPWRILVKRRRRVNPPREQNVVIP